MGKYAYSMDAPVDVQGKERAIEGDLAELDKIGRSLDASSSYADMPVEQWSKAQIEAYLKENSGKAYPPESSFLERFDARCKELKMWPYDNPHVSPQENSGVKYRDKLNLIATFSRQELRDYESGFNDSDFVRSKSETDLIGAAIASRHGELDELIHGRPVKSILKSKDVEAVKKQARFEDAVPKEDSLKRKKLLPVDQVPAPFSPEDFEALSSDNDSDVTGAEQKPVGKDLPTQSVVLGTDPLTRVPTPSVPDSKATPSPAASPAPEDDAEIARKLSEQLAGERRDETPGGPKTTQLPVVIVTPANSPVTSPDGSAVKAPGASQAQSDSASKSEDKRGTGLRATQGVLAGAGVAALGYAASDAKTPGGPDSSEEESSSESESGVSLVPGQPQNNQGNNGLSSTQKILIGATAAALVYGTGELIYAYKTIPEQEWKKSAGFMSKVKLVLGTTWQNIKKRPSHGVDLLKRGSQAAQSKWHSIIGRRFGTDNFVNRGK